MASLMSNFSAPRAKALRSVFLGTTSLYALLLTTPLAAQEASDNCTLPSLSDIGGPITIPTLDTQIYLNNGELTSQSGNFVNCTSSYDTTGYLLTVSGNIIAVNTQDAIVDSTDVLWVDPNPNGGYIASPTFPTFGVVTEGNSSAAVVNFGTIESNVRALFGNTASGDLVGFNSGRIDATSDDSGTINGTVALPLSLASGMTLVSGSTQGAGIYTDTSGTSGSVYNVGGNGANGINAGNISAINQGTILTSGVSAPGIAALSTGGQGGMGTRSTANGQYVAVAVGGNGGNGGNGGTVTVENSSTITTNGLNSMGIKALSVGGGGGAGGTATAQSTSNNLIGASFSVAIGGSGGVGGNGEAVTVKLEDGSTIQTGSSTTNTDYSTPQTPLDTTGGFVDGDHSPGVLAQSIGGGGGSGGHAVSLAEASGIVAVAVSVAKGGTGGAGGDGSDVTVTTDTGTSIVTGGRIAGGIVAQSIGGGGGSGGTVNSQSASSGVISANVSVGMGAAGGSGGSSGHVQALHNGGSITTYGAHSTGMLAQSIAGGGGNGGNVVDGAGANAPLEVSVHVNMGGDAGNGGTTGISNANISAGASITTYGDHASGLVSQSIGGGGGNGGSIHSYSSTTGGGSVSDGLTGQHSDSLTFNGTVNIGGTGGSGAHGNSATSGIVGTIVTHGVASTGALIQSVGGGGGNGGHIHSYSESISVDTAPLSPTRINNSAITTTVNLGGSGSAGGNGGDALAALWGGSITTNQIRSSALVAQSIGGGGGSGGSTSSLDVTTSIPTDPADFATRYASFVPGSGAEVRGNLDVSVNLGGSSGGGGNGGTVNIQLDAGSLTTHESHSHGAVAQSIGGGGGMGGHAVANGFVGVGTYSFNTALGASGGAGGNGGAVDVYRDNNSASLSTINTGGHQSYGIFAQSIGGGGGSGGAAHIDLSKAPAGLSNVTLGLTLGGSGGSGGSGSTVKISDAIVSTAGVQSHGVLAQSIGGGGGNASLSNGSGAIELNLGGSGGNGGNGGATTLQNITTTTDGDLAAGMMAQSIGGGGGLAGIASTTGLLNEAAEDTVTTAFSLNTNGSGGDGGAIFVGCESNRSASDCDITASTSGTTAAGMILQSIGGGGSASFLEAVMDQTAGINAQTTVDFSNGGTGNSGQIVVSGANSGSLNITTSGHGAVGLVAQSIAGNGGALFTTGNLSDVTVNANTSTSDGKSGGLDFDLETTTISTTGDYAPGLFLQSGNALYTVFAADGQQTYRQHPVLPVDRLQVTNRFYLNPFSSITTTGTQSHGVVMETYSYLGSLNQPAADVNDRSLNMWIDGDITVSGSGSWGVKAGNTWDISSAYPIPLPNNVTTAFTLGDNATITAGSGAAGGVMLWETGNIIANINGTINAGTGTAIDISAANTFLTVGDPSLSWPDGDRRSYHGNINVTATAGGTNHINLLATTQLFGGITSHTPIGGRSNITISGAIYNSGGDAISLGVLGTSDTTVTFQEIQGDINATFGSNNTATLTNQGYIDGSVSGPFNYHMNANTSHTLLVDAGPGYGDYGGLPHPTSDIINVNTLSQDSGASVGLELKSLPSSAFLQIFDVITIDQAPGASVSDFNIDTSTAATTFTLSGYQNGDRYEISITDIEVNLNQSGLQGVAAKLAPLAQEHVFNIGITQAPNTSTAIYQLLLNAANAATLDGLSYSLNQMGGTTLEPDAQSTTNAQRSATDSMHSCGSEQGAAVNPVEQGACVWSTITRTDTQLGNDAHDERSTNLAVGWQKPIGDNSYLGFALGYDDVEIERTATDADGDRFHAGAVYKYVDGNLFASTSLLASYSAIEAQRIYSDVFDGTVSHTASSDRKSMALASRLRAGYRIGKGAVDLTPMVDVDLFLNHQFKYQESGTGGLESHISASTNFLADVHPRVQLGTHFNVGNAGVRLYGEIGQRFALNDPSVAYGLADGLAGDATVNVTQERESSQTSWGVGMIADLGEKFEMRVTYDITDGSVEKTERFGFKLAYKF